MCNQFYPSSKTVEINLYVEVGMKINNFYTRPLIKLFISILAGLGVVNLLIALTNVAPFSKQFHFLVGLGFVLVSVFLLTKNLFVKYDSVDELIEIEQSSLVSSANTVKLKQKGYVKCRIKDYQVVEKWYQTKVVLHYQSTTGGVRHHEITFPFISGKHLKALKADLNRITRAYV